ncbi:MAG: DUF5060 domain-containing protein [Verrucomicrobiota bacterium]
MRRQSRLPGLRLVSVCWFSLLALLLNAIPSRAASAVERWGVFEIALTGPTNGNPFLDVEFSGRFTHGANVVNVPGFYDGDGIYRVRFSPETQGEWRYETKSNRRALNRQRGELTVTEPSLENHGPVHVTNTFHFAYADGTPYKEFGTTCYRWVQQTETVQGETLQTLKASPFNKVRFFVAAKRFLKNGTNDIEYPFESSDTKFDAALFNPKYFRHFERRILDLQQLGIEADLILFHPYDEDSVGFGHMTAVEDERYLRYVIARLAAYRNVWWSLANEYDFLRQKTEADWERIGQTVARNDAFHRLLSIHNGTKMFDQMRPWLTHASVQNGSALSDPNSAGLYRDAWRKPVVYDEIKYEGDYPRRWGQLTGKEMVFRFWNSAVAGTHAGHGETFESSPGIRWWRNGGRLVGQSLPRLHFLKHVLDDAPAAGIEPIDKWQNPEYGGRPFEYYLIYFGKETPTNWLFRLPKSPFDKSKQESVAGMKFTAEVFDTWNMTVTPVAGEFTLGKPAGYFVADRDGRTIELPGRPYQAIRIKRLNN